MKKYYNEEEFDLIKKFDDFLNELGAKRSESDMEKYFIDDGINGDNYKGGGTDGTGKTHYTLREIYDEFLKRKS